MALNVNPTLKEIIDEAERLNNLIVNRGGSQTITPSTINKVLSKGYYKGDITVAGDSNLVPANIVSGKSIFGIAGSATLQSLGGKRWASGTVKSASGEISFQLFQGASINTINMSYVTVSGLNFTPSTILLFFDAGSPFYPYEFTVYQRSLTSQPSANVTEIITRKYSNGTYYGLRATGNAYVNNTGFRLPASVGYDYPFNWIAIE